MADRFPGPETPDDRLVLRCKLCFVLHSGPLGLPYLPPVTDVLVPARFETVIDRLTLEFRRRSENRCHYGEIGVLLSLGIEDGELFLLEVTVDVVVFEELDGFQDLIASAAEPGEFRYEDDVDRVVQAEGEGLLENGPVLVGLPAGDVLLEGLDDREMVGGCVAIEVFHLTGGVLTGFQGTGGTATGEDDGGVHKSVFRGKLY